MSEPSHSSQSIAPLVALVGACLSLSGGLACVLCRLAPGTALTWLQLAAIAIFYVLAIAGVYAALVRSACALSTEGIELSASQIVRGTLVSALSLPLLVLLVRERSLWAALIPVFIVGQAVRYVRRATIESADSPDDPQAPQDHKLFAAPKSGFSARTILLCVLASLALQAGLAALLVQRDLIAALLFAACVTLVAWMLPLQSVSKHKPRAWPVYARPAREIVVAFVFTAVALTPFVRNEGTAAFFSAFLQPVRVDPAKIASVPHLGGQYSGIVLYPPRTLHQRIAAPSWITPAHLAVNRTKPMEILFDGVYWYFEPPDKRPKPDAPVLHGDPKTVNIRSTHDWPVSMVANQYLDSPLQMNCCRSLRVGFINADGRPGPIYLTVFLRQRRNAETATESLGTMVIPSSYGDHSFLDRQPAPGSLDFPFPQSARMKEFDEIIVEIEPRQQAVKGARVSIQEFVLMPQ